MKKVFFIFLLTGFSAICFGQRNPCPPGYVASGGTYVIDKFNFHKPRTDCGSGFGICLRGHWEINCIRDFVNTYVDDYDKINGGYLVTGDTLKLYIPKGIKNLNGFNDVDFRFFEVEDEAFMISEAGITYGHLKGGIYPVIETDNDLVVLIKLMLE